MTKKEVFYRIEGLQVVNSIIVDSESMVSELLDCVCKLHDLSDESIVFLENESDPLNGSVKICELLNEGIVRVHINRCKQLKVSVNYNGIEAQNLFAPSITISEILKWVTMKEFGMDRVDASECLLRISGQMDIPKPNIHVGSLISFPKEQIFFDLITKERIQGMYKVPENETIAPDERVLSEDIEKADFRIGVAENCWKFINQNGVILLIGLQARDHSYYNLRLDCTNYPNDPPTGTFWNKSTDSILEPGKWPQSNGGRVQHAFIPGSGALYIPCDRSSIQGHEAWKNQYPSMIWRPADGIVQYLEIVSELLNCNDYVSPS